jgi:methyl-accepting chemotaxis protein
MLWISGSKRRHEMDKLDALDRSLAIIEFTPEGTILSANENFCRTLGYAPGELTGKHHRLFVDAAFAQSEDYRAFWRKLSGGAFDAGVYKRLRKDGSHAYIQATYNPVKDAKGIVVSVMKVAADVTQARIKAMEDEAKMAALSHVQGIAEFKPNGEIIDANDNFLAIMGYRREEIVGKNHRMFVDANFVASDAYRAFWAKLNAGEAVVDSFHRIGVGGKKVWLQASYNPVFDVNGKVYKVIKFASDISDLQMLGEGLARLSKGDLRERLERPFAPTFDKLRTDFNVAADNLNSVLRGISDATGAVGASTEEIASASLDLSSRTESQAASLEETAAALTEVTQTVQDTTKSALLANQVVSEAKGDAERSGEIVARAVEAMGRIEHSSQEIGNIIGVIDEIAFQTNLLALNAGVEAARAGEAGRGFAVVATEVRGLAQRSADAAKQIKGLISASGADVAGGVKLVRQTGEALGAIVKKVIDIDKLVGNIAAGAQQQNAALAEVNSAVSQMDQSTQQNAAMAEQANAAAGSMKQQMQGLNDAIGGFRIAGAPQVAASRPARPRRAA